MVHSSLPLPFNTVVNYCKTHLNPILCLYTDGGPDHCTNFLSVQVALLGLLLDLDLLVAARTASHSSYRNPVERIMSPLDLGLQSIGADARRDGKAISNANSMDDVRKVAEKIHSTLWRVNGY